MANQYFIQPARMSSQFVPTDCEAVLFQSSGVNASVTDGTLAVLGGMALESVYTAAFGSNRYDLNTKVATLPSAATDSGIGIIDLANVPTVTNASTSVEYRMGTQTVGLSAAAGVPVRFRKLRKDDTLFTGGDNFVSAPTVGQYAKVDATTGKWTPSASIPATGLTAQVVSSSPLAQGIDVSVTQYFLLIVQVA